MTQIKIIVSEKQELFRKSLVSLLKSKTEFEVVADAADGRELIEHLKQNKVDVVLLDTELPVIEGKAALEIIRKRFPETKVIVLSIYSDGPLMSDFLIHGAGSFLCKNDSVEILFKAIVSVKKDGYFFDSNTSKALLETALREKKSQIDFPNIKFNNRETEIMKKICDGKTNKEIASCLHLSSSTIDFYRTRIYSKIKCKNATGLLKFALKNGIVALS